MGRTKQVARQKKAKDPNKPKRATSAYFFFLAQCREDAKKQGRSISKIAEFTKISSVKWREMSDHEKKYYEDKALKDKDRYQREMECYGGVTKKKDPTKPKRPQSAYFLFLGDYRIKMKSKNIDHRDILKMAGEAWRTMTPADKMPYEKRSQEEQKKYEDSMERWRRQGGGNLKSSNGAEPDDDDDEEEDDDEEDDDEEDDE